MLVDMGLDGVAADEELVRRSLIGAAGDEQRRTSSSRCVRPAGLFPGCVVASEARGESLGAGERRRRTQGLQMRGPRPGGYALSSVSPSRGAAPPEPAASTPARRALRRPGPGRGRPSDGLGRRKSSGRGLDLAEEAVGGQGDERLARRCGERQGLVCGGASAHGVAGRPVIARPGRLPIRLTKDAPTPGQPAIVRVQPRPSPRQVARIEAEVGRQALQEEPFLVDEVAGLSGGSRGKRGRICAQAASGSPRWRAE